jgi:hypothetical protein
LQLVVVVAETTVILPVAPALVVVQVVAAA